MSNTLYAIRDKKTEHFVEKQYNWDKNKMEYFLWPGLPSHQYNEPPLNIEYVKSFFPDTDLEIVIITYTIEKYGQ